MSHAQKLGGGEAGDEVLLLRGAQAGEEGREASHDLMCRGRGGKRWLGRGGGA